MSDLPTLVQNLPVSKFSDDDFAIVSKSAGGYLPRLQLMTAASEKCKSGEFPINSWALIQDSAYKDLGKRIDVLVLGFRPKAMQVTPSVLAYHTPSSNEFQAIMKRADTPNSGCMYGPEFLVWIPSEKSFATFFMGSKSARREAGNVRALIRKPATLASVKCTNSNDQVWYTPQVTVCSTPFELPSLDEIQRTMTEFENPRDSEVTLAEPEGRER